MPKLSQDVSGITHLAMGISADTLRIQLNTKFWLGKYSCIWQATITKPWSREGRMHLLGPPRRKLWCRFLLLLPNISAHLGITAMFRKVMLRKELKMGSGANTHRSVQYLSSIHRSPSLFPQKTQLLVLPQMFTHLFSILPSTSAIMFEQC